MANDPRNLPSATLHSGNHQSDPLQEIPLDQRCIQTIEDVADAGMMTLEALLKGQIKPKFARAAGIVINATARAEELCSRDGGTPRPLVNLDLLRKKKS